MDPRNGCESVENGRYTPPLTPEVPQDEPPRDSEKPRTERSRRTQSHSPQPGPSSQATWVPSPILPSSGQEEEVTPQRITQRRSSLYCKEGSNLSSTLSNRHPSYPKCQRGNSQPKRLGSSHHHAHFLRHGSSSRQNSRSLSEGSPSGGQNSPIQNSDQPEGHQTGSNANTPENETINLNNAFIQFVNFLNSFLKLQNSLKIRYDLNMIPEFDPSVKHNKIESWISKVNECAAICDWNDQQTSHFALKRLLGNARRWYEGLQSDNRSWPEWQDSLKRAFPSETNYNVLLSDMLERRHNPDESLDDYYYEKMMLLKACDVSGKRAVDCIIQGLDNIMIKISATSARFNTPEDLLAFLKDLYH